MYFEWLSLYHVVAEELGIDPTRDYLATYILRRMMLDHGHRDRHELSIQGTALVVGAGPSLSKVLNVLASYIPNDLPIISADGATRALLEVGITPLAVVTDLDGDVDAVEECCKRGSTLFIHAHGDNIDKLLEVGAKLCSKCPYVIGTTQVPRPPKPLVNPGGFTDGDRACLIAYALGAKRLILVGMDLCSYFVGRYSKGIEIRASRTKLVKLWIARRVIDSLGKRIEILEVGTKCLTNSRCIGIEEARALVRNGVW